LRRCEGGGVRRVREVCWKGRLGDKGGLGEMDWERWIGRDGLGEVNGEGELEEGKEEK
jgi:hypothetical protein